MAPPLFRDICGARESAKLKRIASIDPSAVRSLITQLARFCGVGAVCLGSATAGLAALHEFTGMYYLTAYAISFCFGNLLGYLLNGRFTFGARVSASGGTRYLLLNAILLAINTVLMKLLVDGAHIWYIAACLTLAIATTPLSFVLHRRFSYAVPPAEHGRLSESTR